ncbi:MAG: hypothetical protein ACHP8A_09115 [Terriglobales bacterium]|nr:hypothetical protein [Terriglobales bacterium]
MENYFNYFTEIEEHFQRRRGSGLILSTLDWALIDTWKDAGVPLEAVLRGIDTAFDKYERRPSKVQKINGLAYCAQAVLVSAEEMKEAAVGVARNAVEDKPDRGFQTAEIAAFLKRNAAQLESADLPDRVGVSAHAVASETAATLYKLADEIEASKVSPRLEDLERRLTVLEDKIFAVLLAATPDEQIVTVRAEADHELSPYRSRMPAAQIQQLQKQYLHKKLLEKYKVPRLSLFYMT